MNRLLLLGGILSLLIATGCSTKGEKTTPTEEKTKNAPTGGPRLGGPGMGGGHRPTPSPELQALIDETVPSFKQYVFVNDKGDSLQYNLFVPKNIEAGKKYPLVLFMADASTPGPDPLTPLIQG